jgi:2-C-methyl-D-erythritol 4-phosphate cytidylyltransferase/2-C-methyl-D-erythritol 2,4-cyclodiphosphate synthase
MKVVAAILAAGRSTRLGQDKTLARLGSRSVWQWSFETYRSHPRVSQVLVVCSDVNHGPIREIAPCVLLGGETRQQSAARAIEAAGDADALLLHDAARPFVGHAVISGVIEGIERSGAAAAAIPVPDTIKEIRGDRIVTLDRASLVAMQTPQGAKLELLRRAHAQATGETTDDMAVLESIGVQPEIVPGDPTNFKITDANDLERARLFAGQGEQRVGFGYDVHAFSKEADRPLVLGGVSFPGHPGLEGHSDADVLLHAATDALLGAASAGDIGRHFPNTDPKWRNEPSLTFLKAAAGLLADRGWSVVNLDLTIVAESPKVAPRSSEITETIAQALGISADRVSLKATTNERLGFVGRGEGIAALATAAIRRG